MDIEYEKQTLDHPNPIARFAHRARFAYSKSIVYKFLQEGSTLVDYGCGQGRFLHDINNELKHKKCYLYGYDPYMASKFNGYEIVSNVDQILNDTVDIMTCLEVCEHLDDKETHEFINFAYEKLVEGGMLLVTVPIMIGPAVLIKEFSRSILFRRMPDMSFNELFLSSLLGIVPSRAEDIKNSHKGYDWRVTLQALKDKFIVEKIDFSPIKFFGWYGNSQAIMLFRKGASSGKAI